MMNNVVMRAVLTVSNRMFFVLILPILYDTKYAMSTQSNSDKVIVF